MVTVQHQPTPQPPRPVPGPPPSAAPQADPRAGIEEAMAALDDLDQIPLAEHVERFDAVHSELTFALSSIDKV
ncbi:hypothetical protein GCM10017786_17270 [Amycolatopsis deserti]|uniref:Uncharacterized protein n=1 Tax=Amycolatopsis deserti TaxID=185696 RepID=A0ABQ3IPN6_9PSEU|nr:hypothetical protein CF166_32375 [Amycolatopsis sp. KNN50.9b]GHE85738.1 hypothetical protein GCM10017786_17270 [Amycolatopsis deserti]